MAQKQTIDAMWDDSPIDVSTEVNFIWSIANKLRGTYQSDKYKISSSLILMISTMHSSRDYRRIKTSSRCCCRTMK